MGWCWALKSQSTWTVTSWALKDGIHWTSNSDLPTSVSLSGLSLNCLPSRKIVSREDSNFFGQFCTSTLGVFIDKETLLVTLSKFRSNNRDSLRGLEAAKPWSRTAEINFGFVYDRLWRRPLAKIIIFSLMTKMQLNIILLYLYNVNYALINWGGFVANPFPVNFISHISFNISSMFYY